MLLTQEHMKNMKQKSVSVDTVKTMERFKQDFSAANAATKNEIAELSGQKHASIYRVYSHGTANARLVLAMAQVLTVSPYFYTGAEDEKTQLTDELLLRFLNEHGYGDIAEELSKSVEKPKRKYNKKSKTDIVENIIVEASQDTDDGITEGACPVQETDDTLVVKSGNNDDQQPIIEKPNEVHDAVICDLIHSDFDNASEDIAELTEEEIIILLRALFIRAKSNVEAAQHIAVIKRSLLS